MKSIARIVVSAFLVSLAFAHPALAKSDIAIEDVNGNRVTLTEVETVSISFTLGDTRVELPLDQIKEITAKDAAGNLLIKLTNDESVIGKSTSKISGKWELGSYEITLDKIKSLIVLSPAKPTKASPAKGFVAQVTDSQGITHLVYGFSFGYTYSYSARNCVSDCERSGDSSIFSLPINQDEGSLMMPIGNIASIENLQCSATECKARVVLKSGEAIESDIGSFGPNRIGKCMGKTSFGNFGLSLAEATKITFEPKKFVNPLPKENWGVKDKGLKCALTFASTKIVNLSDAMVFDLFDDGTVGEERSGLEAKFKVGESDSVIDLGKLSSVRITREEKDGAVRFPSVMKTKKGNVLNAELVDGRYLGGYTKDGLFYCIRLMNTMEITF